MKDKLPYLVLLELCPFGCQRGGQSYTGKFFLLFYDTPRALLLRCEARYLASDSRFYYYLDQRFGHQWAFSKAPADNFAHHPVWSRREASDPWRLRSGEAVMAQDRPSVSVPAAERHDRGAGVSHGRCPGGVPEA